jgi:hypothetical protein
VSRARAALARSGEWALADGVWRNDRTGERIPDEELEAAHHRFLPLYAKDRARALFARLKD